MHTPVAAPAISITHLHDEPVFDSPHEPRLSLDDSFVVSAASEPQLSVTSLPDFEVNSAQQRAVPTPEVSITPVPVVAEPAVTAYQIPARSPDQQQAPTATPTLSDVVRQPGQLPEAPVPAAKPAAGNNKPASNPAARRKIIALRLPMAERVAGEQLLSLLQREQLQHGKFGIFHRMHDAQSVFSVASMVEPGTFDPGAMAQQQFPGVTLFMLLPGPVDGLIAYDQMMSCAQRIAHATGGTLQDERGSKLTAQTMERLREEVLDFQHLLGSVVTAT
jgi:cell division protein ZipA